MAESPRTELAADRNLLLGILAWRSGFVSREQLTAAAKRWALDRDRPLDEILVEQQALTPTGRAELEPLIDTHLATHGGDVRESLRALGEIGEVESLFTAPTMDIEATAFWTPGNGDSPSETMAARPALAPASRYHILRPHAKGGLGEVYVARDEELNREVALKEIQPQFASRTEHWPRFVLEAEITGSLEHPGIVPVYGLGSYADGRPYYAMRFIKGDSLQEAIRRFHEQDGPKRSRQERSLALRELLGRFVDVCQAIAYAHSRGVLHRDLKPGNVMLGNYGETLVVDWGLAKTLTTPAAETSHETGPAPATAMAAFEAAEAPTLVPQVQAQALAPRPDTDSSADLLPSGNGERPITPRAAASGQMATQMGQAIGTPAYMSPEQAAGQIDQLGPGSDVYSLGATLYHLLTGRPPFEERDLTLLLTHVQLGEFPRPRSIKSSVPAALEAICMKAMGLLPADRYASALELAAEVERWLADEPVQAFREPWSGRMRRWLGRHRVATASAAVAALMAIAGLAIVLLLTKASEERERTLREEETAAKELATRNLELARAAEQKEILQQKLAQDRLEKGVEAVERMVNRVTGEKWAFRPELEGERREVLEEAILFFKQLGSEESQDPAVRRLAARSYLQSGNVQVALGNYTKSAAEAKTALELYEGLVAQFPTDLKARVGLVNALILLGGIDAIGAKYFVALPRFEQASKVAEETLKLHPDAEAAILSQIEALVGLARYYSISDRPKSQQLYNKGLALAEKLLAKPEPSYQARLMAAVCLVNRGAGESALRQNQQAFASFERARKILAPAEKMSPPNTHSAAIMAQTQITIDVTRGVYLCRTGKKEEGLATIEQGIERMRKLKALIPRSFPYQILSMQNLVSYAYELTRLGMGDKAQKIYDEADEIRDKLLVEVPQMTWLKSYSNMPKSELVLWKIQQGRLAGVEEEMDNFVKTSEPRSKDGLRYNSACMYSQLSKVVPVPDRERCAAEAVKRLNELLANKYFDNKSTRDHLDDDPDLVPLHKRADYQAFLKAAKARGTPAK
jgi:serine/threonine-protein kinase